MYRWRPKGVRGPIYVEDPWAQYEGVYHTPTKYELKMIARFLLKFAFEDDEFDENENEIWVNTKKSLNCPDLRRVLIEFVKQVRESKGYDVEMTCGFFGSPFMPLRLDVKRNYDEGMAGTNTAIKEINRLTLKSGNKYKLVSLDKYVRTVSRTLLLTISALETDLDAMDIDEGDADADADGCLKTIQALVAQPTKTEFLLLEWKFKPESYLKLR